MLGSHSALGGAGRTGKDKEKMGCWISVVAIIDI